MFANATRADNMRKRLPPDSNQAPFLYLAKASSTVPWSAIRAAVSCSPHPRQNFCSRLFSMLHRGQNMGEPPIRLIIIRSGGRLLSAIEKKHPTLRLSGSPMQLTKEAPSWPVRPLVSNPTNGSWCDGSDPFYTRTCEGPTREARRRSSAWRSDKEPLNENCSLPPAHFTRGNII